MKRKKISRLLTPLSGIMSFMIAMGVMTIPVSAEDINTESAVYEENVKTDYATYVNSTAEKNGFKLTISKVTAARNSMKVTALIECPQAITQESLNNSIFILTVKKSTCQSDRSQTEIIDENTIEVNFEVTSYDGIPKNADLRFDVILPEYNLNGWVNASVDLSKNFDKIIEKDINMYNHKAKIKFSKFQSDVLGASLYFKEDDNDGEDYENRYSDSDSKILVKCDDRLYEFTDKDYNHYTDGIDGRYKSNELTYDKFNNAQSVTLIPLICNLKNKEVDEIYNSMTYDDVNYIENTDNVQYQKKFNDGKDGEVTKVEREDDKVKLYINTDSEKKSLLMACGIDGWAVSKDGYFYSDIEKTIYKDPDSQYGYIIEFSNVDKDAKLNTHINDVILGHSSDFELGQEVKVK